MFNNFSIKTGSIYSSNRPESVFENIDKKPKCNIDLDELAHQIASEMLSKHSK
jgi:hypothetical protein